MKTVGNFIGGQVCLSSSNQTVDVHNPASGQVERHVTQSTAAEVKQAIDVAHQAFADWSCTTPLRRARIMFNFKALLEQHRDELAELIVSEHGKVYSDALGELTRGMEVVEFACGIPHLLKGEYSPDVGSGVDSFSLMQPLGVVAGITPFNFPAMVPMWMFPIAGLRQHLHPQAAGAGAFRLGAPGGAAERSRPAGRRVQRGALRQ